MNIDVRQDERGRVSVTVDGRKLRRRRTSSRDVYLDTEGGVVVKVDSEDNDDRRQCANEIANWEGFDELQKSLVSRLIAHGKVKGGDGRKWVAHERVFGRSPTAAQYEKYGMHVLFRYLGLEDDQEKNVLLTKSGPVVVDYGL